MVVFVARLMICIFSIILVFLHYNSIKLEVYDVKKEIRIVSIMYLLMNTLVNIVALFE